MKKNLINRIESYFNFINEKLDQKVIIFIFFLIVSTISWFLIALSQEYSAFIRYPVRYINFPPDKILVNDLPKYFDLFVESYGKTILKYRLRSSRKRIIINVNSYPVFKMPESDSKYYILTNSARDKISNQISSDLRLLEIKPDSIIFEFAKSITKKIKVKPNIDVELEKQFMLKSEILVYPDSIQVSGANNIIDTLKYISTKYQKFSKVDKTIQKNIPLFPNKHLSFSNNKVLVTILVEQYTESEIIIPISVDNIPDSIVLKLFPNAVEVVFNVSLSNYNKIVPGLFEAVVDYNSIYIDKTYQPKFLDVTLERYPSYIQSVRFKPASVEYIIEKND